MSEITAKKPATLREVMQAFEKDDSLPKLCALLRFVNASLDKPEFDEVQREYLLMLAEDVAGDVWEARDTLLANLETLCEGSAP